MEQENKIKKIIPIVGIIAVIAIIAIVVVLLLGGKTKQEKIIERYVASISELNASKIIESIDFIGAEVWYWYEEDIIEEFSQEDYEDFLKDYEEVAKEYQEDPEELDDWKEQIKEDIEEIKEEFKTYKIEIKKVNNIKELGKNLYAVDTTLEMKAEDKNAEEDDEMEIEEGDVTFIIYNNKVIYDDDGILY